MKSSFGKKSLAVIVICLMTLMSLPVLMADGNQKEIRDNIVETDSFNCKTHAPFATVAMNSEPILKANILSKLDLFVVFFSIENMGDATAHNVKLSSISFEGNVLCDDRTLVLAEELNPDQKTAHGIGLFFGFGTFVVTITVTCDEGVSDTTSANGVAFGPFCYIP